MTMRVWRVLVAALAVALIGGGSVRSVAAQDDGGEMDFADLEGVEQVVSRTYTIDFAALMATPGAGSDPASLELQGIVTLIAFVAVFDGEDNARSGWETVDTEFANQAAAISGDEATELETVEVDDLGDQATSYTTTIEEGDRTFSTAIVVVRENEYVYIGIGITAGDDPVPPTTGVMEALIATEAGDDEAEVGDDGFYRGGLWEKFPETGDEALSGLAPLTDEVVYPAPDGETPGA